jgi:hypothetical protein
VAAGVALTALILALCACAPGAPTGTGSAASPTDTEATASPSDTGSEAPPAEIAGFKLDEKYERWRPGTMLEIIPNPGYGPVYPYVGGVIPQSFLTAPLLDLYGFTTADGTIICDPAFSDVTRYERGGDVAYIARRDMRAGSDAGYMMWLLNGDASAAVLYDEVVDAGGGYFAVSRDGKWGAVDFAGADVLPQRYAYPPYWGNGLFVVSEGEYFADSGLLQYYYVNECGEAATDVYPMIWNLNIDYIGDPNRITLKSLVFSNGFAPMFTSAYESERNTGYYVYTYGYIDKTNALAVPDRYNLLGAYEPAPFDENGRAVVYRMDESSDAALIDSGGNEIIPFGAAISSITHEPDPSGDSRGIYITRKFFRAPDGEPTVVTKVFGADGNETRVFDGAAQYLGGGRYVVWESFEGSRAAAVIDGEGVTRALFPRPGYDSAPSSVARVGEDSFMVSFDSGAVLFVLFDGDGNVYYERSRERDEPSESYSEYASVQPDGNIGIRVWKQDSFSAEYWTWFVTPEGREILSPESGFQVAGRFGELFAVRQGHYGGLADADGEWIVKRSLLDYIDD